MSHPIPSVSSTPSAHAAPRQAPEHEVKNDTGSYDPNGQLCKPPRDERGATGESVRVNVEFSVYSDCKWYPPFKPYDMGNIPYQLYNAGVTDQEWVEFVKRLDQVNKTRDKSCSICSFWGCILGTFFPPLYCFFLKARVNNLAIWDNELRKWQDDFNNEVLTRHGCFVKTKSHCYAVSDSKAGGRKVRMSVHRWITFALNPTECEALKHEPHMTGYIDGGDLLAPSVNEATCCIHP
jgi:hypothetical protein